MKTTSGDILTVNTGIILQQVNCHGVMGAGIALAICKKYPIVYTKYLEFLDKCSYDPLGNVQYIGVTDELIIINLFAQRDYGFTKDRYTSYDALDSCLEKVSNYAGDDEPIHYPLLGCGLGGGEWTIVSSIIEHRLKNKNHILWTL